MSSLLIIGILLWILPHLFKRIAPARREAMGNAGKGLVAAGVTVGLVLMVLGYRASDEIFVYAPPSWGVHLNNTLMFIAVLLFGVGNSKSRLRARMRHPMLIGTLLWGVSHLLVNGDLASLVLFGSMIAWALVEMTLINRQVHSYVPYDGGSAAGDVRLFVISIVVFIVLAAVHWWLGYYPFPR